MFATKIITVFLFLVLITPKLFSQGNCNCWIPLDSTFQVVPMTEGLDPTKDQGIPPEYRNDDGSTLPINLPFTFCYYGQNYNTVFINNNGNISFIKPIFNFSAKGFPYGTDTLMISPFYSDVDTRPFSPPHLGAGTGLVYYKITPTYMIVTWDAVCFQTWDCDFPNTFQLIIANGTDSILPAGNNVSFCYKKMGWASSDVSGGWSGWLGTPATVGVNKGNEINYAQFSTFNLPGMTYSGPFSANNGLHWLNNKSFIFNTCVNGNNIPPVVLNSDQTICDTVTVCPGATATVTASFLCPQAGQTSTLSALSPALSGISVFNSSNANSIASFTVQIAPSTSDIGTHVLNITATDNCSPALTNTIPVIIVVPVCQVNVSEPIFYNIFSVYPNPGYGSFTIQMNEQPFPANSEARVYDVLGNNIYRAKLNNIKTKINLFYPSRGIYFLKLYKDNIPIGVEKIVIE